MVNSLSSDKYEEWLVELGMVSLGERRHRADMQQVHKILHGLDKEDKNTWFEMATEGQRTTRQAANPWNLRPKQSRLDIRKNFFSQRVINNWNMKPTEIQGAERAKSFKKAYARHRDSVV
jgi:hypothetical protein